MWGGPREQRLNVLSVGGGPARVLAEARAGAGLSWVCGERDAPKGLRAGGRRAHPRRWEPALGRRGSGCSVCGAFGGEAVRGNVRDVGLWTVAASHSQVALLCLLRKTFLL